MPTSTLPDRPGADAPGPDLAALEAALGHRFADPGLPVLALTHKSLLGTGRGAPSESNERLEFLGDRVLGLAVAEALYANDPGAAEGDLNRRLSSLVRKETLAEVAVELGLPDHLRALPDLLKDAAPGNPTLLADALEAVIAAVFLDAGFEAAKAVVLAAWRGRIAAAATDAASDAKSALQAWLQARGRALPIYVVIDRTGPDHAPVFTVEARAEGLDPATATAPNRRAAEQAAAGQLLAQAKAEA